MSKERRQKNSRKAVYNSRTDTFRLAGDNTPSASTASHQTAEDRPDEKLNEWRNEPGVDEPLRVGRAIRTRDEFFMGQKGKTIHPEQPAEELYRRAAVIDIDDNQNLEVVIIKRPNARNGVPVPYDKQRRKYIPDLLTLDDDAKPIKLKKNKFEMSGYHENLTETQALEIKNKVINSSHQQSLRATTFDKGKKDK